MLAKIHNRYDVVSVQTACFYNNVADFVLSFTQGAYLWNWKDKIDRAFMKKYGDDLPAMRTNAEPPESAQAAGHEALAVVKGAGMRCGGCGAKVSAHNHSVTHFAFRNVYSNA